MFLVGYYDFCFLKLISKFHWKPCTKNGQGLACFHNLTDSVKVGSKKEFWSDQSDFSCQMDGIRTLKPLIKTKLMNISLKTFQTNAWHLIVGNWIGYDYFE